VIRGPAGEGRVAAVLRDDLADAVVTVLTSDGHDEAVYEITGPSAFSLAEIAELLGTRYVDETRRRRTRRVRTTVRPTGRSRAG
jgi:uncharacterized protein YbjT (DUF2867 family)